MKIGYYFLALLPACIDASTFTPRSSVGYLSPSTKHSTNKLDVDITSSDLTTPSSFTDEYNSSKVLSYRGGEGSSTNVDIPKTNELVGAAFFTVLQVLLTKVFRENKINFPAMLGCTILVFTTLVLA